MKQVLITIPDMQSTHCQTRVNNAINKIAGVQVQKVEAGHLTVSIVSKDLQSEIENSITKAGYSITNAVENKVPECSS